ncbi:MAG TPA: hypothetical protein G4O13_03240 [Dehalococcoidia bacterium]|nr:hypothetical protein [Dehalococcoidia bacterium]
MTLKNVLASVLVIALGVILIIHFTLFWIHGGVFIHESNKAILSVETVMSVAILGFGVERLLNYTKEKQRGAADSTTHAVTMLPRTTTLFVDSSADRIEERPHNTSAYTHDTWNIDVINPDTEGETAAPIEAT